MHLLSFRAESGPGVAIVRRARALDLAALGADFPHTLDGIIAGGQALMDRIKARADTAAMEWHPVDRFTPAYPIQGQHKIFCVGLNYAAHAREGGNAIPEYPALFMRSRESMIAAGEPIVRPRASHKLDYEAELMVVIGKRARNVDEAEALHHVFGYTIFNDGSVRDYQRKGAQWTPGKNFDRTGPVGPMVVTSDALPPGCHGLDIACRLNGQTMQSSNTSDMIFSVSRTIAIISEFATLLPGDLIAMGTPSGVGYPRTPPVFLAPGDIVEVEIEGIGILRNPIADE